MLVSNALNLLVSSIFIQVEVMNTSNVLTNIDDMHIHVFTSVFIPVLTAT